MVQCNCYLSTGIHKGNQCPNRAKLPIKNPIYCGRHFNKCKNSIQIEHIYENKQLPSESIT